MPSNAYFGNFGEPAEGKHVGGSMNELRTFRMDVFPEDVAPQIREKVILGRNLLLT